jgi:hypothetical protein
MPPLHAADPVLVIFIAFSSRLDVEPTEPR